MKKIKLAIVAFVAITLCSCSKVIVGSDEITIVDRDVEDYTALSVEGGLDVVVTNTEKGSVSVRTNENVHQYIETEISGGTLVVRPKSGVSFRDVTIEISLSGEGISSIKATGGSSVDIKRSTVIESMDIVLSGGSDLSGVLDVKRIIAEISGGSDLKLNGERADYIELESEGGSDATIFIEAVDMSIKASGGSDAYVWVSNNLDVVASGGCSVFYKGSGEIKDIDISGGSNIEKRNW
ncbi:MAG: head GIN domain-containing protein [Rikenellaceae bacterium]